MELVPAQQGVRLYLSLFRRKVFLTVSAYIVFLYIYTASPHEHSVLPGCLRRTQFFFRNPVKNDFEGCTAAWGNFYTPSLATGRKAVKGLTRNVETIHLQTDLDYIPQKM